MDSKTFQLFVTRFDAHVSQLQLDPVDYVAMANALFSRLNLLFNEIHPIDFENISPVLDPIQVGGHHLNMFRGNLIVPTIDREHEVTTPGGTDESILPFMTGLPIVPFRTPRRWTTTGTRGRRRVSGNKLRGARQARTRVKKQARRKAKRAKKRLSLIHI